MRFLKAINGFQNQPSSSSWDSSHGIKQTPLLTAMTHVTFWGPLSHQHRAMSDLHLFGVSSSCQHPLQLQRAAQEQHQQEFRGGLSGHGGAARAAAIPGQAGAHRLRRLCHQIRPEVQGAGTHLGLLQLLVASLRWDVCVWGLCPLNKGPSPPFSCPFPAHQAGFHSHPQVLLPDWAGEGEEGA